MASLLRELAVSGVRKSTGEPASDAKIWCLTLGSSGTATLAPIYADEDGLVALSQPVVADAGGRAVIYVKTIVQLYIEDADGLVLVLEDRSDATNAAQVEIELAGYTGTILSGPSVGSQGPGGRTDLATVLTAAAESIGGPDFEYMPPPPASFAVSRPIQIKLTELGVSVKDFGAVGDGAAIDSDAFQAAGDYVATHGGGGGLNGGIVQVPPGIYRFDATVTFTGLPGLSFVGTGAGTSVINQIGPTTAFSFINCQRIRVEGLRINGGYIRLTDCDDARILNVHLNGNGVIVSGGNRSLIRDTGVSSGTGIDYSAAAPSLDHVIQRCAISSSFACVSYAGQVGSCLIDSTTFAGGSTGVLWNGAATGQFFTVSGCPSLARAPIVTPFGIGSAVTDRGLKQFGNNVDGYSETVVASASITPDRMLGSHIRIVATGAGTPVINAPTPTPLSTGFPAGYGNGIELVITFVEGAGAVTAAWSLNAIYVLTSAGAIPVTANSETTVRFLWNGAKWRETSRGTTV